MKHSLHTLDVCTQTFTRHTHMNHIPHKPILQLLEQPSILVDLGRDQFGNFVMQKLVEVC